MSDTWHSFECREGCSPPTGVIVDVRVPSDNLLEVKCPVCGQLMDYRGQWAASEGGFGSTGDHDELAQEAVDEWLDALVQKWEAALRTNPPNLDDLEDMPRLPGPVSLGGFIAAVRSRRKAP